MIRQLIFLSDTGRRVRQSMGTASSAGAILVLQGVQGRRGLPATLLQENRPSRLRGLRGFSGLKETEVVLKDRKLKVAIARHKQRQVLLERHGQVKPFTSWKSWPAAAVSGRRAAITVAGNARSIPGLPA